MDLPQFQRLVQKFVRRNYPGHKAESVTIRLDSGQPIHFPIAKKRPCVLAGASEKLAENEMHVLSFIPAHDKPPKSSEAIADEAGYKHNSYFMTILRGLRKKKLIVLEVEGYRRRRIDR